MYSNALKQVEHYRQRIKTFLIHEWSNKSFFSAFMTKQISQDAYNYKPVPPTQNVTWRQGKRPSYSFIGKNSTLQTHRFSQALSKQEKSFTGQQINGEISAKKYYPNSRGRKNLVNYRCFRFSCQKTSQTNRSVFAITLWPWHETLVRRNVGEQKSSVTKGEKRGIQLAFPLPNSNFILTVNPR